MAQENVELVRSVLEGWAPVATSVRGLICSPADLRVEAASRRCGGRALIAARRSVTPRFAKCSGVSGRTHRIEADEYIDAGVTGWSWFSRARGTARGSGLKLDQSLYFLSGRRSEMASSSVSSCSAIETTPLAARRAVGVGLSGVGHGAGERRTWFTRRS